MTINSFVVIRRNGRDHHLEKFIGSGWKRMKGSLFKLEESFFAIPTDLLERSTIELVSKFAHFLVEFPQVEKGVMTEAG